ncbi:restriction endonuclease subunit S [Vibrio crassostreae]|uniref:restriction endonuclease subunit S n=1 Tax=Vibrio crassostreae TaxID=246167 RepID=UPI00200B14BA|nr:restriction endonuclease subunit S [Vibrio crassostreae]UPR29128.1 restriction endonuclease subunit S [Vibrio crassostreae]
MIDDSTPRLRFDGFGQPYKKKKIRSFCSVKSGSTPLRSNKEYFRNGYIPWVKTTDLNNSLIIDTEEKVTDLALKETSLKVQPAGSVLVAMYGGFKQIGRTGRLKEPSATNQALSVLNPKKDEVCSEYLQHYLNAQISRWRRFAASSRKDPNITSFDVGSFPVLFCSLEEQQKIADFLTAIDTKISQLTEKHRLFKEYKKGVMQQIFSQKIRFKDEDGNAFPEWKEYALKEILLLQSDSLKMGDEEIYELITVKRGFGGVKSRGHFKGKDVLVKNQFTIHENEFVISKRQIVHGACGLVPSELDGAIVSNEYNVFRPVEELLDIEYFNRLTTTPFMRRAFFTNSDGVHIEKLLFKTQGWLKTRVHIPCLEEQQKITQFLQAIDFKIKAIAEQIEQTKQFKKGLLQQMFV